MRYLVPRASIAIMYHFLPRFISWIFKSFHQFDFPQAMNMAYSPQLQPRRNDYCKWMPNKYVQAECPMRATWGFMLFQCHTPSLSEPNQSKSPNLSFFVFAFRLHVFFPRSFRFNILTCIFVAFQHCQVQRDFCAAELADAQAKRPRLFEVRSWSNEKAKFGPTFFIRYHINLY